MVLLITSSLTDDSRAVAAEGQYRRSFVSSTTRAAKAHHRHSFPPSITHRLHCRTFSLRLSHQADKLNAFRCSRCKVAGESNQILTTEQPLTSIKGVCHTGKSSAQSFPKPEVVLQASAASPPNFSDPPL
jgi:hypothetical protein